MARAMSVFAVFDTGFGAELRRGSPRPPIVLGSLVLRGIVGCVRFAELDSVVVRSCSISSRATSIVPVLAVAKGTDAVFVSAVGCSFG